MWLFYELSWQVHHVANCYIVLVRTLVILSHHTIAKQKVTQRFWTRFCKKICCHKLRSVSRGKLAWLACCFDQFQLNNLQSTRILQILPPIFLLRHNLTHQTNSCLPLYVVPIVNLGFCVHRHVDVNSCHFFWKGRAGSDVTSGWELLAFFRSEENGPLSATNHFI